MCRYSWSCEYLHAVVVPVAPLSRLPAREAMWNGYVGTYVSQFGLSRSSLLPEQANFPAHDQANTVYLSLG